MKLHWVTKSALWTLAAFIAFVGYVVTTAPGAKSESPPVPAWAKTPDGLPECDSAEVAYAATQVLNVADVRLGSLGKVVAESTPSRLVCRTEISETSSAETMWAKFTVERHQASQLFIHFMPY